MNGLQTEYGRTILGVLCAVLVWFDLGCKPEERQPDTPGPPSTQAAISADPATLRPEQLFGTYVVVDYARYRGGLTSENEAKAQIGTEAVISGERCEILGFVVRKPRYAIRYYEDLPEGNVPHGHRRLLSSFWGFSSGAVGDTVLEVYARPGADHAFLNIEVIDSNTLWQGCDGWLFQLRRKGASGRVVPLTKREFAGND